MKEKPFRIELKNPCSQNWDAMPLLNGGLYCGQCTKVVTDFTEMSDEELINFLGKKRTEEICGKFFQHQLEKVYVLEDYKPQRSYHSLKLLLAGFLTLPLSIQAQSSASQNQTVVDGIQKKPGTRSQVHRKVIKGKVLNRLNYSGIRATIKLYANNSNEEFISTFSTDSLGQYTILLPDTGLSKFFRLIYSSSDNYLERMIVVDRDKAPSYLPVSLLPIVTVKVITETIKSDDSYRARGEIITMEPRRVTGGIPRCNNEIVFLEYPINKHFWSRIKGIVRKIFRRNK